MCGIAGFSLTPNSNIKVRQLAHELLTVIEDRGGMASGFAWQMDNHIGWHKDGVGGSNLPLSELPKDAKSVILHTRLATHGSVTDNRNNHPVLSPSEDIALVHNGVIYNHKSVRKQIDAVLPDVDTSVISALIENSGVSSIDELDGDAAIAWFNKREHNTLHLARYQHSPLVVAQLEDGSFVFCSTEQLLWRVLVKMDLTPEWMYTVPELEYLQISNGVITSKDTLPKPKATSSWYDYDYYRHQTSGANSGYSASNSAAWTNPRYAEEDDYCPASMWVDDSYADDDDDDYGAYTEVVTTIGQSPYRKPGAYWIAVRDSYDKAMHIQRYKNSEYDVWADDCFDLVYNLDLEVVDYGYISKDGSDVSVVGVSEQWF